VSGKLAALIIMAAVLCAFQILEVSGMWWLYTTLKNAPNDPQAAIRFMMRLQSNMEAGMWFYTLEVAFYILFTVLLVAKLYDLEKDLEE